HHPRAVGARRDDPPRRARARARGPRARAEGGRGRRGALARHREQAAPRAALAPARGARRRGRPRPSRGCARSLRARRGERGRPERRLRRGAGTVAVTRVRIATRASALALAQASAVARALGAALGCDTELVPLTTSGDRLAEASLARLGGKGLFVKE